MSSSSPSRAADAVHPPARRRGAAARPDAAAPAVGRHRAVDAPTDAAAPAALALHGRGVLRFMGLPVYDAVLRVAPGFDPQQPLRSAFELSLTYHRRFDGTAIVERSLLEMRHGGEATPAQHDRWRAFMAGAFADVARGDVITGGWQPQTVTSTFRRHGHAAQSLADADFGARFFGIWLAPQTSQPALRAALLGL